MTQIILKESQYRNAQISFAPNNGPVTQVYTTDANGEVTIDFLVSQLPVAMNFTAQGYQDPGGIRIIYAN